jgi:hypothetical protein
LRPDAAQPYDGGRSSDGYTFRADQQGLAIEPGPEPITLTRAELEQLGVIPKDEYQIPLGAEGESGAPIDRMVIALAEGEARSMPEPVMKPRHITPRRGRLSE